MTRKNAAASGRPHHVGNRRAIIALSFLVVVGVTIARSMEPAAGQSKTTDNAVVQTPTVNGAGGNQETFRSHVRDEMADLEVKDAGVQREDGGPQQPTDQCSRRRPATCLGQY
jgi:hypothetical protein